MRSLPIYFKWLALAAFADWLVTRTLTRMAIFMPKPPAVILFYQALGFAGQAVATLAGLLALLAFGWMAWREFHSAAGRFIPAACLGAVSFNLLFLYKLPTGWLAVGYHALLLGLVLAIGRRAARSTVQSTSQKMAAIVLTLALVARELYQITPAAYQAARLAGPPAFNQVIFLSAELFALFSLLAVWWAYARTFTWKTGVLASIPALAFVAFHLLNPAMLGIISIWSTGFTLYLPWLLYAFGVWAASVVIFSATWQRSPAGWAVLLLLAGGLAPQFSVQAFLGIVALWLLSYDQNCRETKPGTAAVTAAAGQPASTG
jgi:hypothetical protein